MPALMSLEVPTEDSIVYNVINPKNRLLDYDWLKNILTNHGLTAPSRESLECWQCAFVHSSYCKNPKKPRNDEVIDERAYADRADVVLPFPQSNERLEWLGDGILQSFMAQYLFRRFPDVDEGFLSKARSKLVKKNTLSFLATQLGFAPYILMSTATEDAINGRELPSILEDTFEAFVGVISIEFGDEHYKDPDPADPVGFNITGYHQACKFLHNVFEKYIDIVEVVNFDDNYIHQLMCYYQKRYNGQTPVYKELSDWATDRFYRMAVLDADNRKIIGVGQHRTKREAKQKAAQIALKHLGLLKT